jgi:hypothetical protein
MAANARSSRNLFAGFFPDAPVTAVIDGSIGSEFQSDFLKLPKFYDKDSAGATVRCRKSYLSRRK